jgi:peptidoglycan/xylan/chitin deacetylase (PgdA/CDA1 family)
MPGTDNSERASGTVYLTLDVESDYARSPTLMILDRTGPFFKWARDEQVPFTAFVTGRLIEQAHPIVDQLQSAGIPVELHGYTHDVSGFGTMHSSHAEEIERGTDVYEKRFGHVPAGYRAPSGVVSEADIRLLDRLGYRYDSSIFPVRRHGRYDFSNLPHHPFRWEGLHLAEFPLALLTSRVPAGLTFMNLLGSRISSMILARSASASPAPVVIDGHFHNLFPAPEALRALPLAFRFIYRLGEWTGGLACLRALVSNLRGRGLVLGNLAQVAQITRSELLPAVNLTAFGKT